MAIPSDKIGSRKASQRPIWQTSDYSPLVVQLHALINEHGGEDGDLGGHQRPAARGATGTIMVKSPGRRTRRAGDARVAGNLPDQIPQLLVGGTLAALAGDELVEQFLE